jgi:MOSC domain-containing protein YiiM
LSQSPISITVADIALRRQRRGPMLTVEACNISTEQGVGGDFRGKPGKRQVTLLSEAAWQDACESIDVTLPWTVRRANILVRGRTFSAADVGKIVSIGEARLEITRETDPCQRMDDAQPGLKAALAPDWHGGVCCRVLNAGDIRVGDTLYIN